MRPSVAAVLSAILAGLWPGPVDPLVSDPRRDNLRIIVHAGMPPYAAIGRVTGSRVCTGTLVLDPRIVVTAAHCVVDSAGNVFRKPVSFQLKQQDGTGLGTLYGHVARVGSARQYKDHTIQDEPMDWAIIVLDRAPPGTRPLYLKSVSATAATRLAGQISLPAFSIDVAGGTVMSVDQGVSIIALRWGVFLHDSERAHGSSGAPLLVDTGEGHAVIGINTACLYEPRPDKDGQLEMLHAAVSASSFESALRAVRDHLPPLSPPS